MDNNAGSVRWLRNIKYYRSLKNSQYYSIGFHIPEEAVGVTVGLVVLAA